MFREEVTVSHLLLHKYPEKAILAILHMHYTTASVRMKALYSINCFKKTNMQHKNELLSPRYKDENSLLIQYTLKEPKLFEEQVLWKMMLRYAIQLGKKKQTKCYESCTEVHFYYTVLKESHYLHFKLWFNMYYSYLQETSKKS